MLLEQASEWLGWPQPQNIFKPAGEGAAVIARAAKQKIGEPLKRAFPGLVVETGILTLDPLGAGTAVPLAVICQFPSGAQPEALRESHRLTWNFSRTALLVTLEPQRLMAWSCFQHPDQPEDLRRVCKLPTLNGESPQGTQEQQQIRELLHWVSLITGNFLRRRPDHFPADGRADALLLKNLKYVRSQLIQSGLAGGVCHDLLARIIFTQFLFHRKDRAGNPFLSKSLLESRCEGSLRQVHSDLESILRDKDETYSLFLWLDDRFNGDLFPGKEDQTDQERRVAWQAEKDAVKASHLELLADLVSGTIDTTDRQLLLWPKYSFDTIPLEFISSVYEEFLTEDRDASKAYYTPPHLVDYVLDAVLPWEGDEWNLRILDPACGSGIFLVKAFQRIIHRWRRENGREPLVRDLKPLLANNFYGVDNNADAIRVACFSLYLAMADAIDPKHYATREKTFPRLRGRRLITKDYFDESTEGFRTAEDARTFDLVIGNAPWAEGTAQKLSDISPNEKTATGRRKRKSTLTKAQKWARIHDKGWPVANHDIGPLFVAKALHLVTESGHVAMLQPAPSWLYSRADPAKKLRKKFFESFTFTEITNLSALRYELFPNVIGPACVVVVGRDKPDAHTPLHYFTPKPLRISAEEFKTSKEFSSPRTSTHSVEIEPQDVSRITHDEAANDPLVWSALALGGGRDLHLIRRLQNHDNLAKLKAKGRVLTRLGIIKGKSRQKTLANLRNKPFFDDSGFPDDVMLELDAARVSTPWADPKVTERDSTDFEAFKNPQLLIKQSLVTKLGRFRSALVRPNNRVWGVICKKTFLSIRDLSSDARHIRAAALVYNSCLATYYLALASGRIGHYRTETNSGELVTVPLPEGNFEISCITTFDEIDELTRKAFLLTKAEWTIIEDFLEVSFPDALRKKPGLGRKPSRRTSANGDEPELSAYGEMLTRVLKSSFGRDKAIAVTIYRETDTTTLPVRMVTVHLNWVERSPLTIETIASDGLLDGLASFHRDVLGGKLHSASGNGSGFRRVAFFFHSHEERTGRVQNLTIIKPDEYRYWTRSQAMRDADELATAIMQAAVGQGAG